MQGITAGKSVAVGIGGRRRRGGRQQAEGGVQVGRYAATENPAEAG